MRPVGVRDLRSGGSETGARAQDLSTDKGAIGEIVISKTEWRSRDLIVTNPTGDEPARELQYDRRNGHRGAARTASVRGIRIAQCNETESAHCEKETNNVFVRRRSGRPAARRRGGSTRRHRRNEQRIWDRVPARMWSGGAPRDQLHRADVGRRVDYLS